MNPTRGTLTPRNLTKIINLIGRKRILDAEEWIEKLDKGELSNKHVCLTFDDGLKSQIKIALPILEKYKIKAFWFVHCKTSPNNFFDKNEIFSLLIFKDLETLLILLIIFSHIVKLIIKFLIQKNLIIIIKRKKII